MESLRLLSKKQADSSTDIDTDRKVEVVAAQKETNEVVTTQKVFEIDACKETPDKLTVKTVEQGMPDTPKVTHSFSSPSVIVTKVDTPRMLIPRREFLDLKADVAKIRSEIVDTTQKVQSFSDALLEHSKANGEKMDSILAVLQSLSDGFKVYVDSNLKK